MAPLKAFAAGRRIFAENSLSHYEDTGCYQRLLFCRQRQNYTLLLRFWLLVLEDWVVRWEWLPGFSENQIGALHSTCCGNADMAMFAAAERFGIVWLP
jgi:hypothetical protein